MELKLKPEELIRGLGTSLDWQSSQALNCKAWLLKPNRIGERDTELGAISFPTCIQHFLATRPGVFWMTPKWVEDPSSLPKSKRGEDLGYVLVQRDDGSCVLLLPIPTSTQRGRLFLDQGIRAGLRSDPGSKATQTPPAFLLTHGSDPIELLSASIRCLRHLLQSFKLSSEKSIPGFVDTLGWCTWDAFYKEVDQTGVQDGVRALAAAKHSPGFVIIDDGWQKVNKADKLQQTQPDEASFPTGLNGIVDYLKSEYGVRWVGVWHTLQGYWSGIDPNGSIGQRFSTQTVEGSPEAFQGWHPQFSSASRTHIKAEDIEPFYQSFYQELAKAGVDIVKVDNQAQLEIFSDRPDLSENRLCSAYQNAVQGAASEKLKGNLLHCMGQATEIYCRLSEGNLARNSDDFYPQKPDTAQVDHIVQNTFNAPFTSQFCLPDWDMFQTYHPRAQFHAIARIISGGPLYISDKPELTDHTLLDRLVLGQNRILRLAQAGLPLSRQFFSEPRAAAELLVLTNPHQGGFGAVAFFNCHADDRLMGSFKIEELTDFKAENYALFDPETEELSYLASDEPLQCHLDPTAARLYSISPMVAGQACLGISGKLNGIAAMNTVDLVNEQTVRYTLNATGPVAFASEQIIASAKLDGVQVTPERLQQTAFGFIVDLPEAPMSSCCLEVKTVAEHQPR